ncbi:hypothetical protein BDZ91DRAFT_390811 [Kalaharituber pfeilii]|nr:hypothetical protein BDZ91DRAFT_390811 [Kalaharituber pfeilii]
MLPELKDVRSDAVPSRREKERKVRYRHADPELIGTPRPHSDKNQAVWTHKNLYRMNDFPDRSFGPKRANQLSKKKALGFHYATADDYVLPQAPRKGGRSVSKVMTSSIDDDTLPGITYSYDYNGPSVGADVFGTLVEQAEIKYENKVFDKLIKTEYEMIETSEEESEEEFEIIDV